MFWCAVWDGKLKILLFDKDTESPDLSTIDYWFWLTALVEERRIQPNNLEHLQVWYEVCAVSLSMEQFNKAVCNIFFCGKCCIQKYRGQVETFLKKQKPKKSNDN